jgi:hypothetical protein
MRCKKLKKWENTLLELRRGRRSTLSPDKLSIRSSRPNRGGGRRQRRHAFACPWFELGSQVFNIRFSSFHPHNVDLRFLVRHQLHVFAIQIHKNANMQWKGRWPLGFCRLAIWLLFNTELRFNSNVWVAITLTFGILWSIQFDFLFGGTQPWNWTGGVLWAYDSCETNSVQNRGGRLWIGRWCPQVNGIPHSIRLHFHFQFPWHWWPQIPIPNSMLQCRHPNTMLGKSSEGSVLRLNSRTSWPFKVSSTTSTTRSICCTLIILIPSSSLRPWLPWGTHPATTSGLFAYLHLDIRVVIADWLGFLTVHLN